MNWSNELAKEKEEEDWWSESPYKLILLPDIIDGKQWKTNPESIKKLRKAGYCLEHAKRYVLNSHLFNSCPIASGTIEFLEQHQKRVEATGLKTKIIYKDVGMKICTKS